VAVVTYSGTYLLFYFLDNSKNNIIPFYYPTELHDFAGSDLTVLDKWCIEKVS